MIWIFLILLIFGNNLINYGRLVLGNLCTKEHWRDYHPDKEEWAKVQREHRQYKHNLYINKKIGVK